MNTDRDCCGVITNKRGGWMIPLLPILLMGTLVWGCGDDAGASGEGIVDAGALLDAGDLDSAIASDVQVGLDVIQSEQDVVSAADQVQGDSTIAGDDTTAIDDTTATADTIAGDDVKGPDATVADGAGGASGTLCNPCAKNADCDKGGAAGALCVDLGADGSFCGSLCAEDGDCADGYHCKEVSDVDGQAGKQCMPKPDAGAGDDTIGTCTCSEAAVQAALSTKCYNSALDGDGNPIGTCSGVRVCGAKGLSDCDAAIPSAEVCDGNDNDCDGVLDEDTCNDDNQCTTDKCDGANGCVNSPSVDPCDDGDLCTEKDACKDGVCAGVVKNCDDGNDCTVDSCDVIKGGCVQTKDSGGTCNDGDGCTVDDLCADGVCMAGTATVCNDDNVCTADSCDPKTGDCKYSPVTDGDKCDDGSACTEGDVCTAGACSGKALNCDDKNPCTMDSCDLANGCQNTNDDQAACDDGDACTEGDVCADGTCSGALKSCDDDNDCTKDSCDKVGGCAHDNTVGACDDGDKCTTGEQCKNGKCGGGQSADCDDDDPCTTDGCDKVSGLCSHKATSGPCDDGAVCTDSDSCKDGKCVGVATNCDDGNSCTKDYCDSEKGCVADELMGPCDDGSVCTTDDVCKAGSCVGVEKPVSACDDGNPCTLDTCHPKYGCISEVNDKAPCDDGDVCTTGDYCKGGKCESKSNSCDCKGDGDCASHNSLCGGTYSCVSSKCVVKPGTPVTCTEKGICYDTVCEEKDGKASCVAKPTNEGKVCDDSSKCTHGDYCKAGACVAGTVSKCDDKNLCTSDKCDPNNGCEYTPVTAPCEDGNKCTAGDACADGKCVSGKPANCDDDNLCTNDKCDPVQGCMHMPNAVLCDDGDKCTSGDQCKGGECISGAAKNCDDSDVCTADACDKLTAACSHVKIPGCTGGCKTSKDCPQDLNPCTKSACNLKTGLCQSSNFDGQCSDGEACTVGDKCVSGVCKPGAPLSCDDKNACTKDFCDSKTGKCAHIAKIGCKPCAVDKECVDTQACTVDKCVAGVCVYTPAPNGTKCGTKVVSTAYQCTKSNQIQVREGYAGCTGLSQTLCSTSKLHLYWTPWKALKDCPKGTLCVNGSSICKPIAKICKTNKDCDDKKVCTLDVCKGGFCANPLAKPNTKCGTLPVQKQFKCDSNTLSLRYRYGGCTGTSSTLCSTSKEFSYWSPFVKVKTCATSEVCDATKGVCKPKPNLCWTDKMCDDGKPCTLDHCEIAIGAKSGKCVWKLAPKTTKCGSLVVQTKYSCSATGQTVYRQQAYAGCTGASSTTCSSKLDYLYWTSKYKYLSCLPGTTCDASTGKCKLIPVQCKVDGDCNDSKVCTVDHCIKGKCDYQLAPKTTKCGSTAVKKEFKCAATGTVVLRRLAYPGCTGTSSTLCSTSSTYYYWTAWQSYAKCMPGLVCNPETAKCEKPVTTCETTADCNDGKLCTLDKCVQNKCQYKTAPVGTRCGTTALSYQYQCSSTGQSVMRRAASAGCTGSSTTICSTSQLYYVWSVWKIYKSCIKGYVCDLPNRTCKKLVAFCKSDADCDDGKACTLDKCSLGKCLHPTAPKGTKCGTGLVKSEYKCSKNALYRRDSYPGCTGLSGTTCSTSSTYLNWTPYKLLKICKLPAVCSESAKACVAKTCKTSADCNDNKGCTLDICSAGKCLHKVAPKATKCGSVVRKTEYRCSNNAYQRRQAFDGCSGASTLCSLSSSYWSWSAWSTLKYCSKSEVCSVKAKGCVKKLCKSSLECNDGKVCTKDACILNHCSNTLAPKQTKCGTKPLKTVYSCKGQTLIRRSAYAGCTGLSATTCLSSDSYLAWTPWTTYKLCLPSQVCSATLKTCVSKTCKSDLDCNDGKVCSVDKCVLGKCSNKVAPKLTKCGTKPLISGYSCNKSNILMRRDAYAGCTGVSTTMCSTSSTYYSWTLWKPYKVCTPAQICSAKLHTCLPKPCKSSGECNDGKVCTKDVCLKGQCSNLLMAKTSKCGTKAVKTLYKCSDTGKTVYRRFAYAGCTGSSTTLCSTSAIYLNWTPWTAYKKCGLNEYCDASAGVCKPQLIKCTNAKDCNDGKACSVDSCVSGKCVYKVAPKATKCGATVLQTAYKCSGLVLSRRYAYGGCTGTSTTYCSTSSTNYYWTPWTTVVTCNSAQVCSVKAKGCLAKSCTTSAECSDGKVCTTDICLLGKCKNLLKTKGSKCGSTLVSSQYKCDSNKLYKRSSYAGCTGSSATTCSTSSTYLYWTPWSLKQSCSLSQVCSTSLKTCVAKSCKSPKECYDGKACTTDACISGKCSNKIAPKGTKCGASIVTTAYQCSGLKLQRRYAYRGCTGSSATICSVSSANYYWTSWSTVLTCNPAQVCSAKAKGCVAKSCKSSLECNDGMVCSSDYCVNGKCKNTIKPKTSKCGASVVKTEYKCSSNKLYKRSAYAGCTGASTTICSTSSTYLSWTNWGLLKACNNAETCSASAHTCKPKFCTSSTQCNDGKVCTIDKCVSYHCSNTISPKHTKCGTMVLKYEYKCSLNKLYRRSVYAGCSGSSATMCSTSSSYYAYSSWSLNKTCTTAQVCSSYKHMCLPKPCKSSTECSDGKVCTTDKCISGLCVNSNSPKNTKCGKTSVKVLYSCGNNWLYRKYAYAGCTGYSATTCSTSSSYLYWTPSTLYKKCTAAEVCTAVGAYGACKSKPCKGSFECNDFNTCTLDQCSVGKCTNKALPAHTKCGSTVKKTEWRCYGSYGKYLQRRMAYQGCTASATCSTSSYYYYWTSWATVKVCLPLHCDAVNHLCKPNN